MVLSRFKIRFLSFMKDVLIPNLVKTSQNELLVMDDKQEEEEIFYIRKYEIRVFTK